jgi:2-oxoisovalerate dehydrogenase E2 component (dihydrolipoyl transacylase)
MSAFHFRLPDLGEGTVSAELVAWRVQPGERVVEGQTIAEVSTDKAVVELPAPVSGRVLARQGGPGDAIPVGSELMSFEVEEGSDAANEAMPARPVAAAPGMSGARTEGTRVADGLPSAAAPPAAPSSRGSAGAGALRQGAGRVMASPATRRRAREAGIDLAQVVGSGPGGRIRRDDLESPDAGAEPATEEIPLIGVRRLIAERMSLAQRSIPHFSYIEECDVTELEALRVHLNGAPDAPRLTLLPFVVWALVRVLRQFPQCNAHYDAAREVIVRHRAVHVGIATQTVDGLKVPVVRDAGARSFAQLAAEIRRLTEATRARRATRAELSGSTVTITSLGRHGGLASTPVINPPEVAIIGINRMALRPVVHGGAIAIRQMMNLSSSFDHRFVDGFDAAAMIQALRARLEHPATLFMPDVAR